MLVTVLKAKLHRACVTDADLHYMGSLGVSRDLMDAAGLIEGERVLVANIDNGARLETYVIEEQEPGRMVLNGAAAHHGKVGDRIIVMAWAQLDEEDARAFTPKVVILNERNEIIEG